MLVNVFDGRSWSGWQSLGGVLTTDPAASVFPMGATYAVYLVARGTDAQLWLNRWTSFDNVGRGWSPIGGTTALAAEVTVDRKVLGVDSATLAPYYRSVS